VSVAFAFAFVVRRSRRADRRVSVVFAPRAAPKPPSSLATAASTAWASPRSLAPDAAATSRTRATRVDRRVAAGRGGGIARERGGGGLIIARAEPRREAHLYSMMWGSGLWMA
jgi:hypothetical protein